MLREYKVGSECYLVSVTVLFSIRDSVILYPRLCYLVSVTVLFCIRDMSPKAATFYHVFMQSLFRTLSHEMYHF